MIKCFPCFPFKFTVIVIVGLLIFQSQRTLAANKSTVSSGNWNNAAIWIPAGVPSAGDDVTIVSGHQVIIGNNHSVHALVIATGATLTWSTANKLTIGGIFTVNGTVSMNGGNIHLSASNTPFILGPNSSFTWEPGTNTVQGATLFTNGLETFSTTSLLIIKKWYSYLVPIGSLVTGTFGNLTLNSLSASNLVMEWNQNNYFQSHEILGTLTVDQGWITLDKSGSISNTTIGNIVLSSVNSSFYGHNGNHPSSFTITTNTISNNGGIFYALNDGTGNVTVHANSNVSNSGNIKIINNSGVGGVSNGNATFEVAGTFSQNTGDTRIIYNVTTLNSGTFSATFGNLSLNGGIFMGQTSIHTGGGTSTLTVLTNFNVNFSLASDKFRGTSLSSIGSTMNNVKMNMIIGGNLSISGISSAEFTGSASSGIETIQINGNAEVNGTTTSFNYGTNAASHHLQLTVGGNIVINGGATFLSRNGSSAGITINGNLVITSGNLSIKGDSGMATLQLAGDYNQGGGNFYLHYNSLVPTFKNISMTVGGNFFQSGGILNFDNNASSASAMHAINLTGATYSLSGIGSITHAGAGSSVVFGQLNFTRNGVISFNRSSANHYIQQVKQTINNGCTLNVSTGDIQVTSHLNASTDYFRIATGAHVNMNNGHLFSNGLFTNCGMQVDSGGIIATSLTTGFYDGSPEACLNASNNFDFQLHAYGIVEYNGINNQTITGSGGGIALTTNHRYGILRINFNGDDDVEYASPSASNITVRTRLELKHGELNLNGYTLTIESGNPTAITRINGYIKSEMNAAENTSILRWRKLTPGLHQFPFGVNASTYIPVEFTPTSGFGGDVSVSTRATTATDNRPCASTPSPPPITTIINGSDIAINDAIDRWWNIKADGYTATVSLSYRGEENTISPARSLGNISVLQWNGSGWNQPVGTGNGTTSGIGKVTATGVTLFSPWLLIGYSNPLPIELSSFMATIKRTEVHLTWTTSVEFNNDFFMVEKSSDGIHFEMFKRINSAGNSNTMNTYSAIDKYPSGGVSYYRLKQTDLNGAFTYSEIIAVDVDDFKNKHLFIIDFGPNPFDDYFWIVYECSKRNTLTINLSTLRGDLIQTEEIAADEGYNKYEYSPAARLPQGIYLLTIFHGTEKITQKIIKK